MTGVQGWWNAKWQLAQTNWPIIELCTQLCTNYVLVIQCVSSSTWHYRIRNCSFRWRRPTMVSDSVTCCTRQWFTTANIVAWWMWACVKFVKWKARPMVMVYFPLLSRHTLSMVLVCPRTGPETQVCLYNGSHTVHVVWWWWGTTGRVRRRWAKSWKGCSSATGKVGHRWTR